jgi:pheromone shutdown protein TraB
MNDSSFVEMSYAFAEMTINKSKKLDERIEMALTRATGKNPEKEKIKILKELYFTVKEEMECESIDNVDLEAMAVVCNTILNMDEVLNKS